MSEHVKTRWVVDSDDIGEASRDILYETPAIQTFMRPDSVGRILLVAPKGFGKTLLLRSKRERLEAERKSTHLLPENALTDKPFGEVRIFSEKEIERIVSDDRFWRNAWRLAIAVAMLKFAQRKGSDRVQLDPTEFASAGLRELYENELRKTVTDHLPPILSFHTSDYFKALKDFGDKIAPVYRQVKVPAATFIDNVDQFFDVHLRPQSQSSGALEPDFWYSAQMGLAAAIRDLHGQNKHLKIFASIRREAFLRLLQGEQMALQFQGSALELRYEPNQLRSIFQRNLELEEDANLIAPEEGDVFEAFFGPDGAVIDHLHVGEPEPIWDYILRHTLHRPRDLMSIGLALSEVLPDQRSAGMIRKQVNRVSKVIAQSYLNEIAPHMLTPLDFNILFALIPGNMLTAVQLEEISEAYCASVAEAGGEIPGEADLVFRQLYWAGLLGRPKRRTDELYDEQYFEAAGSMQEAQLRELPKSDHYIIHPALDHLIADLSKDYPRNFDTLNIAGAGRKWRDESSRKAVAQADIVDFSEAMSEPSMELALRDKLDTIVETNAHLLEEAEVRDGDQFTLIDPNPLNLFKALFNIARELQQEFQKTLRVGADFGVLIRRDNGKRGGMPLRTSARIERIAPDGTLTMTAELAEALESRGMEGKLEGLHERSEVVDLPRDGSRFNLKKKTHEPDLWRELYVTDLGEPLADLLPNPRRTRSQKLRSDEPSVKRPPLRRMETNKPSKDSAGKPEGGSPRP